MKKWERGFTSNIAHSLRLSLSPIFSLCFSFTLLGASIAGCQNPAASKHEKPQNTELQNTELKKDDPNIGSSCQMEIHILGAGQDAGIPQIGKQHDPAWDTPRLMHTPSSIAVLDKIAQKRYLFDATPHITQQLRRLDTVTPFAFSGLGIDGIFLTHAHIGHYTGLMFLGHEAAGAQNIPVYAMSRMANFLHENGPWSQLISLKNIQLNPLNDNQTVRLNQGLHITPLRVPHRDEYSETVGFLIKGPAKTALYLPDIDDWDEWNAQYGRRLEDMIDRVDYAFIDASFYDDNELPGRDMSKIPHPRVTDTMARLKDYPASTRGKVHFIHYNHTNPIRYETSEESQFVRQNGFHIARPAQRFCLDATVE